MLTKFRFPLILVAAAAVLAMAAAAVFATTRKVFDSTVTMSGNNPFHGRVISGKHACEVGRTVKILNKKPGPDGLFGKTTTDNQGKWSKPAMPNGKFYAVVKRREEGTAGTIFVCKRDESAVRNF
jgi:hypothetical protein